MAFGQPLAGTDLAPKALREAGEASVLASSCYVLMPRVAGIAKALAEYGWRVNDMGE